MSSLILGLGAMLVLATGLLWYAVRTRQPTDVAPPADSNPEFFRQRLEELELDRAVGTLDELTFEQLATDLKRQLLAESEAGPAAHHAGGGLNPGRLLWVVVALFVLGSALLYRQIGAWPDWQFHRLQQEFAQKDSFTQEDMQRLDAVISTSLKYRPDNRDLRFWQAQLAIERGDFGRAVTQYRELLSRQPDNAVVMAQLAQALFLANERTLDDEARRLLRRAAEIDPRQTTALGMLGIDAFDRGDYLAAIDHWSLLLQHLGPQSSQTDVIQHALTRAKNLAAEQGLLEGIRVNVHAGDVPLPERGMLYVFAKAANGPGFPLAVVRRAQDGNRWPQSFMLTPRDAMRPEMTLEQYDQVQLTVRFSRSGSVTPASGDIEGNSAVLEWRTLTRPVDISLDQQRP